VSGVKYKAADGSIREARAHLTVVCDGMYSNFRKPLTESADIHHPSFFVGLLLRNVQLPYANHGHVVLAEPSPVLFYPISPTEVRDTGITAMRSMLEHDMYRRQEADGWIPAITVTSKGNAVLQ
jgi:2-polyprenyl-6-methoxyphenol hydroxylase-like FAD-dependent oxidoreductase